MSGVDWLVVPVMSDVSFYKECLSFAPVELSAASMSGSCFKKIFSIYCMASCLVLLEDTAVIVSARPNHQ